MARISSSIIQHVLVMYHFTIISMTLLKESISMYNSRLIFTSNKNSGCEMREFVQYYPTLLEFLRDSRLSA